jgi:phage replication O-like protein O
MQPQLENGYAKIANEILERLSSTYLSPYEWQVLMFIFRKTYGFNKKQDRLPVSQIEKVTGIQKANVSRTLKKLKARNIVVQIDNCLSFNKDYSSWESKQITKGGSLNRQPKLSIQTTKVIYTDSKKLSIQTDSKEKRQYKDNNKRKYASLKNLTEIEFNEIAQKYNVPVAFVLSKYEDLENYCSRKGKIYKNYKSALENFVKTDAIKRIDYAKQSNNKRAIDASSI